MKCINHLDREALGACNHCGKNICSECAVQVKSEVYCKTCLAVKMQEDKKQERSPALAATLSFVIAGLGQIYNGQIGKGMLFFFTGWLVIPWIIGIFDAYNSAKKINAGQITVKARPGCLIAFIVGIVALWISVFVIGLLAAIAIPNFMRARVRAYTASAEATVKTISSAIEAYALDHNGQYPLTENNLTSSERAYLNYRYNNQTLAGYRYTLDLRPDGYTIVAQPTQCWTTGDKIFRVEATGKITAEECPRAAGSYD